MLVRNLIVRMAIIGAIAVTSIPAHASNTWSVYHWARTTASFDLITVDSMTADWQDSFNDTVIAWSASDVLYLDVVPGDKSSKYRRRCKPKDGQIVACNLSYGNTGWLGLAGIYIDGAGHIVKGYAKMNDFYSSYWDTEGERNHVVCQEIGHLLGLGHTSTNGSSQGTCMDYSSDLSSQWPNAHDIYTLDEEIYSHLDSYDSYDGSIAEEPNSGCNAPPGRGCNKKAGARADIPMGIPVHIGRFHEIWVARDNAGGYWIHHVRIVPEKYRHK